MSLLASTNSCAIIYDGDDDFGEIAVPDLTDECKQVLDLPIQKIDRDCSTLANLMPKQQQRFCNCSIDMQIVFRTYPVLQVAQNIVSN